MTTAIAPVGGPIGLAETAYENVRRYFDTETNHRPSEGMYRALEDMLRVLEDMAEEECFPSYYLSPLDCGVGKTTAIVEFIKALLASPDHRHVSVILCVSRLDEIQGLASKMGLSPADFAAYTADDACNALGRGKGEAAEARVLFTTQAMIDRRCDGRTFASAAEFHFRGRTRQVRIWDEAILPGKAITITKDDIASLYRPLRGVFPALVDTLEGLFQSLSEAPDGATIEVPDLEALHGIDTNQILSVFNSAPDDTQMIVSSLWFMAGKLATAKTDGVYGNTALSFRDTLPYDFMPVLITDASGRVRTTYQQWAHDRGGLQILRSAPKSYRNLTVNVWQTGGGKSAFARDGSRLVDGIAATINSKPEEDFLVIHHKKDHRFDIEADVSTLVTGDKSRVHFLNWGRHQATNDFVNVPNVILAGTLFFRASYYEALGRLGSAIAPGDKMPERLLEEVIVGEHRHLILQAVGRGPVRVSVGGDCAPCNGYVIASTRSGIKEALPSIFPQCRVVQWAPVKRPLKGKIKKAVEFVVSHLTANPSDLLKFTAVRRAIGMNDSANFNSRIRKSPDFKEALAEAGIVEHGAGVRPTGFMCAAAAYGFRAVAA